MNIVVSHPTRQHSDKLAIALNAANMLGHYFTLLPDRRALDFIPTYLDRYLPSTVYRNSLEPIPVSQIKTLLGPLIIQRITYNSKRRPVKDLGEYIAWTVFDHWVARQIKTLTPDLVVGYEMCCVETFREAERLGIPRILDAAACHYRYVDQTLPEWLSETEGLPGKLLRHRKDEEIALASQIICVSEFSAKSYIEHGVQKDKIVINPLGCDLNLFNRATLLKESTGINLIYIGQRSYHKGFDTLKIAFDNFLRSHPDATLTVIGPVGDYAEKDYSERIIVKGMMSHSEIVGELARADCLILPSRCESFGLVVIEALAAGTPVMVSNRAGASMAVEEGLNGWTFNPDIWTDLLELILKFGDNIKVNRMKGAACRNSVKNWSWDKYQDRSIGIFKEFIK